MNVIQKIILAATLFFPTLSFSAPSGMSLIGTKEIKEDDVTFKYISNDGSIELKCAHVFEQPDAYDWDVWCGKGTNMLRQFRVHFLVRKYGSRTSSRSAYEVLYWVIDRNQHITKAFSSTSSWIQFKNNSDLEIMSFNQGVENDYAYLTVELKP